jgi:hypothetical protein
VYILVGLQVVFNIEKLINTIYAPIRIVHLNRFTGTYSNKMCIEKFPIIFLGHATMLKGISMNETREKENINESYTTATTLTFLNNHCLRLFH